MAETYANKTKHTSVFVDNAPGDQSLQWQEDTLTWDESNGTWNNPTSYQTTVKHTSVFVDATKH